MAKQTRFWILALASSLAGCSFYFDTGSYIGTTGDGGVDAGDALVIDAPIDANDPTLPSRPEVSLSPLPARTTDDLVAMIVTPSVDPMGGTVVYEYRWLRDDMDVPTETTPTLSSTLTTRGQRWTVEVTPVVGARRGAAGTAEVTIANTPPVLVTVGLDQYHPVVGERVRAVSGSIVDADGDIAGRHYQWYRDGVPIAGATGTQLDLSGFAVGGEVRLDSWATDEDEGAHVTVGPVAVLADVTRWRPITPPTFYSSQTGADLANDVPRERFVQFLNGEAWEFVVSGSQVRTARLAPRGTAPVQSEFQMILHDALHERLLVVDRDDAMLLHVLDLSQRGAESWTTLRATGDLPPVQGSGNFAVWRDGAQIWLYGGDTGATPRETRLVRLDLSVVGAATWTELPLGTDDPNVFLSTLIAHPSLPGHALLFGGADFTTGVPNLTVYDVSLATGAVTFEGVGDMPGPRLAARSVIRSGRIVIAGGVLSIFDPPGLLPVLEFDPGTGGFATIATMPSGTGSSVLTLESDGVLTHVGLTSPTGLRALSLTAIDPAAGSAVMFALEDGAPVTAGAFVLDDEVRALEHDGSEWSMRSFDPIAHLWTRRAILPDSTLGTAPPVRGGFRTQSAVRAVTGPGMALFGGYAPSGGGVDANLWELQGDARWIHRLATSGPTPSVRYGAATASVFCAEGLTYVVAGGSVSGGSLLDDTWLLTCTGERECAWVESATTGFRPAHALSSLVTISTDVLMARQGTPVVSSLYGCGRAFATWDVMTNTGAAPATLALESMTYARSVAGLDTLIVLGGAGSMDEVYELTVVDYRTLRWARLTVDVADSLPPTAAPVAAWDATLDRLLVMNEQTWELRVR